MANEYATTASLKARLGITGSGSDTVLGEVLEGASRLIDGFTGRTFYGSEAETRYFTTDDTGTVFIDDLVSVTSVKTDEDGDRTYERTWASTDYDLLPHNVTPKTRLVLAPEGRYVFPTLPRSVQIVGTWGNNADASIPAVIREATLLQAARLFERRKSPLGVIGDSEIGFARLSARLDPDVEVLLKAGGFGPRLVFA